MNKQRPVNLDLSTLKFPIMAVVSILHRITGVIIFLSLPFFIYLLSRSLASPQSYILLIADIKLSALYKLTLWFTLSCVLYHVIAGLRHLVMDFGIGESLCAARNSAMVVLIVSIVVSVLIGVWLW